MCSANWASSPLRNLSLPCAHLLDTQITVLICVIKALYGRVDTQPLSHYVAQLSQLRRLQTERKKERNHLNTTKPDTEPETRET